MPICGLRVKGNAVELVKGTKTLVALLGYVGPFASDASGKMQPPIYRKKHPKTRINLFIFHLVGLKSDTYCVQKAFFQA